MLCRELMQWLDTDIHSRCSLRWARGTVGTIRQVKCALGRASAGRQSPPVVITCQLNGCRKVEKPFAA
jgi:hypothetical protein